MTENSPEYLLRLMAQIIEVFLRKMNVPREEVDLFTDRIKERKMGELFKYFEGWDIQAVRREAKKEVEKEVDKATEKGIERLLKVIKELSGSRETALEKLMEEYGLTEENAKEKIALYW